MSISAQAMTAAAQSEAMLLFVPLVPLIGAVICASLVGKDPRLQRAAGWIASGFAVLSLAAVVMLVEELLSSGAPLAAGFGSWIDTASFRADFGFRFDNLTAVMALVVCGVGSLIHIYAIGYMDDDPSCPRFFAYLNLFLFAMLVLVLADNLLLMFVGWEGVGLCSYLLIGFWFKDMANAEAGQKAFVVNRIGDAGFLLGVFTLVLLAGAVDFVSLAAGIGELAVRYPATVELAALLLFIGAVGKSAQIPLHVWLPDAMAGPTPVSALIHAATMVTAGIYMIARLSFIYAAAPNVLMLILVIGTVTSFVAATTALAQNDIKKVLAYSTVSQLGYMFMAMGAGAFSNGIYHVVTHAFFKACLFMGAGSVIVGCHHEQDMRKFGGLRKRMPYTFWTYLLAALAIAGFPGTSGFFSKDAILIAVASDPGLPSQAMIAPGVSLAALCTGMGLVTALLTALYMMRSVMLTFFGEYRGHGRAQESPRIMTVPLIVLAALSIAFSLLFEGSLMELLGSWTRGDLGGHHHGGSHLIEYLAIAAALLGISVGVLLYSERSARLPRLLTPAGIAESSGVFYRLCRDKWWFDEAYAAFVVKPLYRASRVLFLTVDRLLVDGSVNALAMVTSTGSEVVRTLHNGRLSLYAFLMVLGVVCSILFWLLL